MKNKKLVLSKKAAKAIDKKVFRFKLAMEFKAGKSMIDLAIYNCLSYHIVESAIRDYMNGIKK